MSSLFVLSAQFGHHSSEPSACSRCMSNRTCVPPDCFCCRDEFKLPISLQDIPQIVFFTFDDALTDSATKFYNRLFSPSRKNPNGCPISMTLFVSHQDTIYSNVNNMYRRGMEIAAHSVSHAHMSNENFQNEAQNQKRNLATLGGVPENEIVGWRSPFLEPVGDMQPDTLKKLGYSYDATLTFSKRSLKDKAPTPFTLDFGWPYDCKVKPCPKRQHFGFWEVPVVSLLDYLHKYDCVYVDGCNNPPPDETSAFNFLMDNFNSYYTRHRVPFGINMHPSWFYIPERLNAMDRFIKKLSKMDDVFIVSVKKMIDWLKSPTGLSQINTFKPWACADQSGNGSLNTKRQHGQHRPIHETPQDAISRRRGHIKARLSQIQEMRRKTHQGRRFDTNRNHHQTGSSRKRFWLHDSSTHHAESHAKLHQKPSPMAPWAHKKHDRPTKPNARIPAMATTPKSRLTSARDVPFWKRKHQLHEQSRRPHRPVAWWEKALPERRRPRVRVLPEQIAKKVSAHDFHEPKQTTLKPKQNVIKPTRRTFNSNPIDVKPTRRTFNSKPFETRHVKTSTHPKSFIQPKNNVFKPKEKTHIQPKTKDSFEHKNMEFVKRTETSPVKRVDIEVINKKSPPKIDFKKQLKEQELKQMQIIEAQRKLQKEQLKRQIEQLKKNNAEVLKKQKAKSAQRMTDIEQKHALEVEQQKSIITENKPEVEIKLPAQKAIMTTVSETFDKIDRTTNAPYSGDVSLNARRKGKSDPWTKFVQFILKNKPS